MACAGKSMPLLACLLASKHALAECGPNASVMKAAAAEVAHAGGPRCRTPGCGCRCCRARANSGTPDARSPARASSTCKMVGGNPQPLRSDCHDVERTQEAAPKGSAFGALARTDRRTRGAPFDKSRGASLEQRSYRWHVCVPEQGGKAKTPALAKHRPL